MVLFFISQITHSIGRRKGKFEGGHNETLKDVLIPDDERNEPSGCCGKERKGLTREINTKTSKYNLGARGLTGYGQ